MAKIKRCATCGDHAHPGTPCAPHTRDLSHLDPVIVRIVIRTSGVLGMRRTSAYVRNERGSLMALGVSFEDDPRIAARLAIRNARSEMRFRRYARKAE